VVANTTTVQDAWRRGQSLYLHGWIYDIHDGLLKDLKVSVGKDDRPANPGLQADAPQAPCR